MDSSLALALMLRSMDSAGTWVGVLDVGAQHASRLPLLARNQTPPPLPR